MPSNITILKARILAANQTDKRSFVIKAATLSPEVKKIITKEFKSYLDQMRITVAPEVDPSVFSVLLQGEVLQGRVDFQIDEDNDIKTRFSLDKSCAFECKQQWDVAQEAATNFKDLYFELGNYTRKNSEFVDSGNVSSDIKKNAKITGDIQELLEQATGFLAQLGDDLASVSGAIAATAKALAKLPK